MTFLRIDNQKCLTALLDFIKHDYSLDPNSWEVGDCLSMINMPEHLFNSDSPTSDPAYWYDWKELIEDAVKKDKSILDENNGLTLEQGLVAMQYFLEQRYWKKNNSMLLKDAYEDLVKEYKACADNFESSKLWQEWLIAVAEGKKFNKVFGCER